MSADTGPAEPPVSPWFWALGWVQLFAVGWAAVEGYQHRSAVLAFASSHPRELAAGFLLTVGGGFLLAAGRFVVGRWRFVRRATRAVGRVAEVRVTRAPLGEDGPDVDWFTPVVRFGVRGWTIHRVMGDAVTTDPARWREGAPVPVLFEPGDPLHAMVDDWTKWRPMNVLLLFGVVITAMGLLVTALRPAG